MTEVKQQLPNILCIDYPGCVENADNALSTLGGIERIEKAFFNRNGKLFLNYNPNNIFSKVLCSSESENLMQANLSLTSRTRASDNAESNPTEASYSDSSLLLKITKRATCTQNASATPTSFTYESELIGKVEKIFTFRKLADFQYLPMSRVENTNDECSNYDGFFKNFHFDQIDDFKQDLKAKIPLYVLPPFFSRFDDPVNYAFKPEPNKKVTSSLEYFNNISSPSGLATRNRTKDDLASTTKANLDDSKTSNTEQDSVDGGADESFSGELIRSVRQERSSQALLITFECPNVPERKLTILFI
jgi:hypothetical protein